MDSILGNVSQNQGTLGVDLQPLQPKSPLEPLQHETTLQPGLVDGLEPMNGPIANFSDLEVVTPNNIAIAPLALRSDQSGGDLIGTTQQVGDDSAQVFALSTNAASANTTPIDRAGVTNIVTALANVGADLDTTDKFNSTLPLPVASEFKQPVSLGTLIDPQTVLSSLQRELQAALPEKATVNDLVNFFSNRWNGTTIGDDANEQLLNPTLGQIQVSSVNPVVTTRNIDRNTTITEVAVTFTTQRNSTFSISDAPELQDQQLDIESATNVALNSGITFKAVFSLGSTVSLKINEFSAHVDEANSSLSDTTMNVGVLGVTATNGAIDLAANVKVNFTGNDDGLTVAELQTPIANLVTLNASSRLDASYQLTPETGITSTQALTGTLDIGNGTDFINNPGIFPVMLPANLRDFTRVNPNELLQPMLLFGSWLDNLDGSSLYAKPLPFVKDVTVGQAIDLGGALRNEITNQLQNSGGLANFATLQDMVNRISTPGDRITASYNPINDELTFRVEVLADQTDGSRPLDLNVNANGLNSVQETANVTIAPEVALDFTYGIDLTAQTQATLAPLSTEHRLLPQNGKLSKNAAFQVLFADGSSRLVTLAQSATADNTSLDNLRADVQAALSNAGLDLRVSVSNNALTFSSPTNQLFIISVDDPTNAAVTELGLRSPTTQIRADQPINLTPTTDTSLTLTVGNVTKTINVPSPGRTSLVDNLNAALKAAFPNGNGSLVTAQLETEVA
ncbi:MAG TPA: hypothetical protein V6C78_04440, partial [Crinalium sp.]